MTLAIKPHEEHWLEFDSLDTGLSEDANRLSGRLADSSQFTGAVFEAPHAFLLRELSEAMLLASEDGWDGHEGSSVDASSVAYALQFINYLHQGVPAPEIAIDRDGEVAFEWGNGPRNSLSVRVGRGGIINYAALIGFEPFYGTSFFVNGIPEPILFSMRRTFDALPIENRAR